MQADSLALANEARVARLATVDVHGRPHLVPITFAIDGLNVFTMIDHKPKSTLRLKRLANIDSNPTVSVLFDYYDDDWSRLWWVRVDGTAAIVESGTGWDRARDLLATKYGQYRERPPEGAAIVIGVEAVTDWSP